MIKHSLLLVLSLFALTGCTTITAPESIEREKEDDIVLPSSSQTSEEASGSDRTSKEEEKPKTASTLLESEYKQFPIYYLQKVKSFTSFKSVTEGVTKASAFGIHVSDQVINASAIKNNDYSYYYNESSGFVTTSHEAYYHNSQAIYKGNKDSDYQVKTLDEYLDYFGTYPFGNSIEGYLISEKAIIEVSKLESTENYKYKIRFHPKYATGNVKIQMEKFGGLDDKPSFEYINVTITVKDDFTPVSIDLESKYSAKSGVSATCEQAYTVTFSNFDEEIEIPGLDAVKGKFSA